MWVDQTCHPFCIHRKSTLFWSHDQYSTLGGSHTTNAKHFWKSCDQYRTFRVTRQKATVLQFVFIGTTLSATFGDAFGLVGEAKWLRLLHFNGYLSISDIPFLRLILHKWQAPSLCLILRPPCIHPRKNYMYCSFSKNSMLQFINK